MPINSPALDSSRAKSNRDSVRILHNRPVPLKSSGNIFDGVANIRCHRNPRKCRRGDDSQVLKLEFRHLVGRTWPHLGIASVWPCDDPVEQQ